MHRVERNGLAPQPPQKASPMIQSFVNGNAIDPGLKAALTVKVPHPSVNLQEYILQYVGGVGGALDNVRHEIKDGVLIDAEEISEGFLRPRLKLGHQRRFFANCRHRPTERNSYRSRATHTNSTIPVPPLPAQLASDPPIRGRTTRKWFEIRE